MMKKRLLILVQGAVQGVGFRPFIFRLAESLSLKGWVNNSSQGVNIDIEGNQTQLQQFLTLLETDKPPRSQIDSIHVQELEIVHYADFTIRESQGGEKTVTVLPDLSTCGDCLAEIFDPHNRRYGYPFTNCTNCGPRYSIIEALPYDRPLTTMKKFAMCEDCLAEYDNPRDRRFHAQPNACPNCGPHLEYWDKNGQVLASQNVALLMTIEAIKQGQILAIKGLGGFHLVVDARNFKAVERLRDRKKRPHKPFALMYPNLEKIKHDCWVNGVEESLLLSAEAPIVLLRNKFDTPKSLFTRETDLLKRFAPPKSLPRQVLQRACRTAQSIALKRGTFSLAENIAIDNAYLGVMLPSTPLHHLLLNSLQFPIVATSANLSDEPICTDEQEALKRLQDIADFFLVHNRPIFRPVDDSIARVVNDQTMVLRRARGYAPYPLKLATNSSVDQAILAVGGHLKNTVAIAVKNQVYLSQHIGDLGNSLTYQAFLETLKSLENLYEFKPEIIAHDLHPNYVSSQYAQNQSLPTISVQHHYAHVLAGIEEHQLETPVLGIAWDGTGCGVDESIWGGEFIEVSNNSWRRIATLEPFPLIGGDGAVKEPRRIALALLTQANLVLPESLKSHFSEQELMLFSQVLNRRLNCPLTSSIGRLFDGVAALLDLYSTVTFEGQAAITLENQAILFDIDSPKSLLRQVLQRASRTAQSIALERGTFIYPFELKNDSEKELTLIQWQPIIKAILDDILIQVPKPIIAAKFHHTLARIIVAIAEQTGIKQVLLTGGCFQNAYLLETAIAKLKQAGFIPYWPQKVPTNDGGIALGQILATIRALQS